MFTPTSKKAGSGKSALLGRSVRKAETTTSGLPSGVAVLDALGHGSPAGVAALQLPTSPIGKIAWPNSSLSVRAEEVGSSVWAVTLFSVRSGVCSGVAAPPLAGSMTSSPR